jgi:hypothetical protein
MRILWFSHTPAGATRHLTGKGGIGNSWVESLQAHLMRRPGVELAVAFPWEADEPEPFVLDGCEYYPFPVARRGKVQTILYSHFKGIDSEELLPHYRKIVEDFQPDIIHVFGTERNFGLIASQVHIPVVVWIQGILTAYTRHWFAGFSKKDV